MKRKNAVSFSNLLAALLASLIVCLLNFFPPFDGMERRFLDLFFQLRGTETPHPDIVVVEIDDTSLAKVGTWPWPRSYHAALLKALGDYRPSAIFYDMIFSEESKPEEDQAFAAEITNAGNVVLPFYFAASSPRRFWEAPITAPIPLFAGRSHPGYVNVYPDHDGHIREITPAALREGKLLLHTSLALAAAHQKWPENSLMRYAGVSQLINFPGPYESFRRIPFDQLIAGHGEEGQGIYRSLQGKVILVGLTASGTVDLKPTAFSALYPGVGVQASMVHTLLSGKSIGKVPPWAHFLLLFFFLFAVLEASGHAKPLKGFIYTAAALTLLFEASQALFQFFRLWLPYFGFLSAASALYLIKALTQLIKTRYETEIMSRELSLASRIQKSFLPSNLPDIPGLSLAAVSLPARQVGGDLYDVLPVSDGKWGVCVGDVSGKGVPAALFMAKTISEFRRDAVYEEPAPVLEKLNVKIAEEGPGGLFLTLLYLIIDPAKKSFLFANGGHEPILHFRRKNGSVDLLKTEEGTPLGVLAEARFDQKDAFAASGDVLLLTSDGVKEAMNARREIFGFERVQAALSECAAQEPRLIVDHVLKRIREFVKNSPQHDDLTVVCIKFA